MGIKIVREGNKLRAKGNPTRSNVGIVLGIIFLIIGLFAVSNIVIAIFFGFMALITIVASQIHADNARKKKLRESGYL